MLLIQAHVVLDDLEHFLWRGYTPRLKLRPHRDICQQETGIYVNKKCGHLSTRNGNICQQETGTYVNKKNKHLSTRNGNICQQETGISVNKKWGHLSTRTSVNKKREYLSTTNSDICQQQTVTYVNNKWLNLHFGLNRVKAGLNYYKGWGRVYGSIQLLDDTGYVSPGQCCTLS